MAMEKSKGINPSMNPKNYAQNALVSTHKNPIVIAIDVTGSMGDWSKVTFLSLIVS